MTTTRTNAYWFQGKTFQNEMIIQNLVEDFYRQLDLTKPVLILCGIDVDAMAATRILMAMFQADLIQYRLKVMITRFTPFFNPLLASQYEASTVPSNLRWKGEDRAICASQRRLHCRIFQCRPRWIRIHLRRSETALRGRWQPHFVYYRLTQTYQSS